MNLKKMARANGNWEDALKISKKFKMAKNHFFRLCIHLGGPQLYNPRRTSTWWRMKDLAWTTSFLVGEVSLWHCCPGQVEWSKGKTSRMLMNKWCSNDCKLYFNLPKVAVRVMMESEATARKKKSLEWGECTNLLSTLRRGWDVLVHLSSVCNSSNKLIFLKVRAKYEQFFLQKCKQNTAKIQAK